MKSTIRSHYGRVLLSHESYRRLQAAWAGIECPARVTPPAADTAGSSARTASRQPVQLSQRRWAAAA